MHGEPSTPVIYFDGICNLCNGTIQYVIKRDKKKLFCFAALQSKSGEALLKNHNTILPDSIILVYGNKLYVKSDAVLMIARLLAGVYSLAVVLYVVPKFIRDGVYDWVARNRYKWYGKIDSCMVPTTELQSRFLP